MCYRLNDCVPLKFVCWDLIPNVLVFRDGAFQRWLGHQGGVTMNRINALVTETPESSLAPLPCGDAVRKQSSMTQEMNPHQKLNPQAPWSWTLQPTESWEINFCCSQATMPVAFCYSSWKDWDTLLLTSSMTLHGPCSFSVPVSSSVKDGK